MASTLIDVADAVATVITATIETEDGEVERVHVPTRKLEEIASLVASVVARDEGRKPSGRSDWQRDYVVDIAIRQKVADDTETDDLAELMETVANLLEDTPLAGSLANVRLMELKLMGPDVEILHQFNAFAGWIRATYRAARRLP